MGWMPPDFLFNATRRPPNRMEVISKWLFPCKRRLVNAMRDVKRSAPDSRQLTKSSRCWGRKPSGPPEDPAGKERMACKTSASSTDNEEASRAGLADQSAGALGCLSWSLFKVWVETGTDSSSEHSSLTAVRTLPSSILAAMASDRDDLECLVLMGTQSSSDAGHCAVFDSGRDVSRFFTCRCHVMMLTTSLGIRQNKPGPAQNCQPVMIITRIRNNIAQQMWQMWSTSRSGRLGNVLDDRRVSWQPFSSEVWIWWLWRDLWALSFKRSTGKLGVSFFQNWGWMERGRKN